LVRVALPPVEPLDVFVQSTFQQDDFRDAHHVRIFEGDPLLFWRLRPNLDRVVWDFTVVSTNGQGLRQAVPVTEKPDERVRILCLGDSVTFGYRVPLVFPARPNDYDRSARPYPELLEQGLRATHPGHDLEVLNMGVPGYTSRQGHAWLESRIDRLAPDLVILCFGWNDIALREATDHDAMPLGAASVLARRVASHSQLLLRVTLLLRSARSRPAGPAQGARLVPRQTQEEFVRDMLAAARVARGRAARAVIVAPIFGGVPEPGETERRLIAYRAALVGAAQREGVPVLEVRELTEAAFPGNKDLFPVEPIHPGPLGHRLLAKALLRFLEAEGILSQIGFAGEETAG
jgi:lysophospholipase L1-like esterase